MSAKSHLASAHTEETYTEDSSQVCTSGRSVEVLGRSHLLTPQVCVFLPNLIRPVQTSAFPAGVCRPADVWILFLAAY